MTTRSIAWTFASALCLLACGTPAAEDEVVADEGEGEAGDEAPLELEPMQPGRMELYHLPFISMSDHGPRLPDTYELGRARDEDAQVLFEAERFTEAAHAFLEAAHAFLEAVAASATFADQLRPLHELTCGNARSSFQNGQDEAGLAEAIASLEASDPECAAILNGTQPAYRAAP